MKQDHKTELKLSRKIVRNWSDRIWWIFLIPYLILQHFILYLCILEEGLPNSGITRSGVKFCGKILWNYLGSRELRNLWADFVDNWEIKWLNWNKLNKISLKRRLRKLFLLKTHAGNYHKTIFGNTHVYLFCLDVRCLYTEVVYHLLNYPIRRRC